MISGVRGRKSVGTAESCGLRRAACAAHCVETRMRHKKLSVKKKATAHCGRRPSVREPESLSPFGGCTRPAHGTRLSLSRVDLARLRSFCLSVSGRLRLRRPGIWCARSLSRRGYRSRPNYNAAPRRCQGTPGEPVLFRPKRRTGTAGPGLTGCGWPCEFPIPAQKLGSSALFFSVFPGLAESNICSRPNTIPDVGYTQLNVEENRDLPRLFRIYF